MYEAFFGLNEAPFELVPDPRFLFMSRSHEDALMMLHHAIIRNKGAALLSGQIGLGKTTISRKLIEMIDPLQTKVVSIVNPILTPIQILQEIHAQLDSPTMSRNRQVLISELNKLLLGFYERGQRVVLIVDEAHLIKGGSTFEELRLLLNWQRNDRFLLNLILMGESHVVKKLEQVPALYQRLSVKAKLQPLDQIETGAMIFHRLKVAGFREDQTPFTPDAIYEIHRSSRGAPRMVSQLADDALGAAFKQNGKKVDAFLMRSVIEECLGSVAA
jgi:general secretion pathway protein A